MNIDPSIFKTYDIRGIYPSQLNEGVAYEIGRAYAELLIGENPEKPLTVGVGQDMRLSSPAIQKSVVKGLLDSGLDVADVGLVSTPSLYFAVGYYKLDGGIQVSASHNPKEYNGFKLVRARSVPVSGDTGMDKVRDLAIGGIFSTPEKPGTLRTIEHVTHKTVQVQRQETDWQHIKPLKIVVDAVNGMGAVDIEALFKDLPCTLIKLNFTLDGSFPVHEPDPLKDENLKPLQEAVLKEKADVGIAPDGDGDRYFFVDDKGAIVRQEILRGIMAQLALKKHPGGTVAYDIRPGRITRDMIEEAGGKPTVTRVGHSLIKEQMIRENAVFGGESSGHYFYKFDYGTFESPVCLVLNFLAFISQEGKPLSEIIKPYQKYFHSGEFNAEVKNVKAKLDQIAKTYADANISYLDGVTVEYPDYWFNVRGANTEPKIRLNLEAKTKDLMEEKRDEVLKLIRA